MSKIAILYHLFYSDLLTELTPLLSLKNQNSIQFLLNMNVNSDYLQKLKNNLELKYTTTKTLVSPNIGKDIGGKLALIDYYLNNNQKSKYLLLLHDKKSPQIINGEEWKNNLLRITHPKYIDTIINLFEKDESIGIICAKGSISNEYNFQSNSFKTTNNNLLKEYIKKFDLTLNDYSFVAGTMFWVRSEPFEKFFNKFHPLELRSKLESGNVLDNFKGTHTHSLERIFSWIVTSQGYTIKEI